MFLSLSTCLFREKIKTTHQTVTFCFFVTCLLMGTFSGSFVILLNAKARLKRDHKFYLEAVLCTKNY